MNNWRNLKFVSRFLTETNRRRRYKFTKQWQVVADGILQGSWSTNEERKGEYEFVTVTPRLLLKDANIVSDLLLSCRKLTLESTHFLLLHPFKGMDLDDAKGMDGRE